MRFTSAAILAILVASGAQATLTPLSTETATIADLPTPQAIFDNAVIAVGGKEAVEGIKTLHATLSMDMMGMVITMDTKWARAGGRHHTMNLPFGEMVMGTDGKIKWKKDPAGYALLEGDEARQFDSQVDMFGIILDPHRRARQDSKKIEVVGKEKFLDIECYRMSIVGKDDEKADVFFEVETGMPVGSKQAVETEMGPMTSTIHFTDWKPEAGVKFFRTIKITTDNPMMPEMQMKVTKIEVNKVPDEIFVLPDEVKKLAEAKAAGKAEEEIILEDLSPEQQDQVKQILSSLKAAGKDAMKQQLPQMEQGARFAPPEIQTMLKYLAQEIKKELARLEVGGG